MYYKGPRGRFDPTRSLIANKVMTWEGRDIAPGECVDELGMPERKRKTLWEQRKLVYADGPRADAPKPVAPITRPVREIIEQRKARDPEFAAALVDIPADWREQHHKTIVKLANDLGADVTKKADAIEAIETELARRG